MPERNLRIFLVMAVAIVAAVLAVALVTRPGPRPPATGAAELVPGDALLYIHVSTDTSRPGVQQALRVAQRLPDFPLAAAAVSSRLGPILTGTRGATIDFASQVEPWLGREVGFALLNTPTSTAGSLIVIDVRNRAKAMSFLQGAGIVPLATYHGISLMRYPSGTTAAFVRHYLVLGQRASLRAAIDAAARRIQPLSANPAYRQAAAGEPDDRFLDAYISVAGIRRVLAPQGGLLGALAVLLYQPALSGTTVAVSAASGGLRVRIHGALDPTLVRLSGRGGPSFTPTLASVMPEGTTLLLDVDGLNRVAGRVLTAGAQGGIAGRVGPLLRRLGAALASEGVDVAQVTSIFSGETAGAVSPPGAQAAGGAARGPALLIVARTKHQEATRRLLAGVEAPLARLFPPPSSGAGQVPEFNDVPVAGVTVHQLALASGLALDYAVFRGLVAVSTSLQAIAGVARHARSLADDPAYQAVVGGSDRVTSLVFLDFNQLLSLAEQTGLARSSRLTALTPDLRKIRAIGLASTRGENDTTAELFLQIS